MKRIQTSTRTLTNGLNFVHVQTGPSCLFEASVIFNIGSAAEPAEKNGVSHLLEHMMYRGCGPYATSAAFSRALEALCGDSNAFTSAETTEYWFQSAAEKTRDCLNLISHFLLYPEFSEFETEKRIIEQEIDEDYNEAGDYIDDYGLALQALFGPSGLGLPIGGTRETIRLLSLDDVKNHRTEWYAPERCVLTLMSPTPADEVMDWAEHTLGNWHAEPQRGTFEASVHNTDLSPPKSGSHRDDLKMVAVNHPDNQFQLRFCFCVPRPSDRVMHAIEILERILDDGASSRLQSEIREEHGLVYDLACESIDFRSTFVFSIAATVGTEHLARTFDLICRQINSAIHSLPKQEELERARLRAQFNVRQLEENHHAYLEERVEAFFRGQTFDEAVRIAELGLINAADVQAAAQLIFGTPQKCVVLVGPQARSIGPRLAEKWKEHFS